MKLNHKLFFKYILSSNPFFYLTNKIKKSKDIKVLVTQNTLYYLAVHFKFSTVFYTSQLVDMFAYETPVNFLNHKKLEMATSTVVYNFHNLKFQERFFIFAVRHYTSNNNYQLKSITELYPNASWLEREVAELHAINFEGKKDVRNLMLQYGDTSSPFRKSYPSIGTKEMFYDGVNDMIIQAPVSLQI